MQVGSRREIKALVRQGRIMIGGRVASDPGEAVDPASQAITVDGRPVRYQAHFYILLNKPAGVITATEDSRQRTVLDILPADLRHPDLFPVGRLDKETEGLLLLTTDGELGHRLLSPRWHVDKRYLARLDSPLSPDDPAAFAAGLTLADGYTCQPASLEPIGPREAVVTVQEGKYHQVRRMFAARGNHVLYLQRLQMGPLTLGDLAPGEARPLTDLEIAALRRSAGLAEP